MTSQEIRAKFLSFFEDKDHRIVPSAPIVTKNDPSLLFINSGMAQFKEYFLGNQKPLSRRIADTQKCLRVSGKHNDLEEVGWDTYHHTFFEMLGNWSFGDYFKKEAIGWAWELLTQVYGLPKDRLYVTVFEGDQEDGLGKDQEAEGIWKGIIASEQIVMGSKKDNFWEMGSTGPCGPCSEIHMDLRSDEERAEVQGKDLVNKDHPQVVEIWNLVFMQYERMADGSLKELPEKHIDTGMGLERLCMAIQGKRSNYDTDLFQPIISKVALKAGKKYGQEEKVDIALRVIADHIRAIIFTIADGQIPSNNGAGYVIRRILRRAIRYGYTYLGFEQAFLHELVPVVAESFRGVFEEAYENSSFIQNVILEEEKNFLRTLSSGLKKLQQVLDGGIKVIDGKLAFELYDTFGFPLDLTALIARESDVKIDEEGFEKAMKEQKNRSKKDAAHTAGDWVEVNAFNETEFIGYDALYSKTQIVKYREINDKKGKFYQLVLHKTPFYPEGGGQIGDTGTLWISGLQKPLNILDTQKENNLIIHTTKDDHWLDMDWENAELECQVDEHKRALTACNHSATHLLHAALKQVLGDHVMQKGSYVGDQLLRFDFSHFSKLSNEELSEVEKIVNEKIRANFCRIEHRDIPIQEAMAMGATALFGEKYGDRVRVIELGDDFSMELCGGTHVVLTGQLGLFKIISESAVAAGVRRIEALTAEGAERYVQEQDALVKRLKDQLKSKDLLKSVEQLMDEKQKLQKQVEALQITHSKHIKKELMERVTIIDGIKTLIELVEVPSADVLKNLVFELRKDVEDVFIVLAANVQEKPLITVMISDGLVKSKGLHAGNIIRELAKEIKGGGGGQDFYATAGGSDLAGLSSVLKKAKELL